jgi:hypothetical protein
MAEDENSLYYIIRQGKVSLQVGIVMLCVLQLLLDFKHSTAAYFMDHL